MDEKLEQGKGFESEVEQKGKEVNSERKKDSSPVLQDGGSKAPQFIAGASAARVHEVGAATSAKELEALVSELKRLKIDAALEQLAAERGAISPQQVAQFLRADVRLNAELRPVVIGADGGARTDESGKPISLDALVDEFLTQFPHHRRATLTGGSGSFAAPTTVAGTLLERVRNAGSFHELERILKKRR